MIPALLKVPRHSSGYKYWPIGSASQIGMEYTPNSIPATFC